MVWAKGLLLTLTPYHVHAVSSMTTLQPTAPVSLWVFFVYLNVIYISSSVQVLDLLMLEWRPGWLTPFNRRLQMPFLSKDTLSPQFYPRQRDTRIMFPCFSYAKRSSMYVYSVLKLYTHANKVHSGTLVAIQILNKSISRFFPMTNIWQIVTAFQAARATRGGTCYPDGSEGQKGHTARPPPGPGLSRAGRALIG